MKKLILSTLLILPTLATLRADDPASDGTSADSLATILQPHLKPTITVLLDHYRTKRKYVNSDFPMPRQNFEDFQAEMRSELARSLGIVDWVVRSPNGKASPLANRFEDRTIKTISLHGVTVELHAVTLQQLAWSSRWPSVCQLARIRLAGSASSLDIPVTDFTI